MTINNKIDFQRDVKNASNLAPAILQHTVTLTDEQIKQLPTVSPELVPPQTGIYLVFERSIVEGDFTGGAYTNKGVPPNPPYGMVVNDLDGNADQVSAKLLSDIFAQNCKFCLTLSAAQNVDAVGTGIDSGFYAGAPDAWVGKGLHFWVNNGELGNFTGGHPNNTLKFTTFYSVIDLE